MQEENKQAAKKAKEEADVLKKRVKQLEDKINGLSDLNDFERFT